MSEAVPTSERLIVALDTPDPARAEDWAAAVSPHCGLLKLGLEFFAANGPGGVARIAGRPIFLDLKLHDIPNTVAGAVRAVLKLRPRMLTLHAGGGPAMIEAARRAAEDAGADRPLLLGVTVLTSLDGAALAQIGMGDGDHDRRVERQVVRLARMVREAGGDGLVCGSGEVAALRAALGQEVALVVPGIRPDGAPRGDQARVAGPAETIAAGADWIVVGRPITGSRNPAAEAEAIARSLPH